MEFTVQMWNRLHRKAADVPSLEVFRAMLGGALKNLVWWKVLLGEVLELDDF